MATYREMEGVVERYEREVWEYNLKLKQKEKPAKKPPEKQSVREHLRQLQEQGKQQSHKKKSFDREGNFGKEKPPLWLYPYTAEYIVTSVYFSMQTRLFCLLFVFFEYMFENYMTTYNLKHHICTQIKNKYFFRSPEFLTCQV